MMKYLILLLTCIACTYAQAQSTVAKLKYEGAEKAFYDGDYPSCIGLLDETEKLLGKSAPNILHLRIMAESKIWEADPYGSYEQLEKLRQLCNQYLKNYDIAGLEEKYRQVYDLSATLPKVSTAEELYPLRQQYLVQLKAEKTEAIIKRNNLAFVEGGTFTMGNKKEAHEVTVSDFYIGKYEVSINEYQKFAAENPGYEIRSMVCANCPIGEVTWQEAMDYCKWLEKKYGGTWRLPTEAEWEYAAIGGKHHTPEIYLTSFKDTDVITRGEYEHANILGGQLNKDRQVKADSFKPNQLGIFNMVGNVREWCYDWFDKNYHTNSSKIDPKGPDTGIYRVIRGISWRTPYTVIALRNALKRDFTKDDYRNDLGFRVVYIPD